MSDLSAGLKLCGGAPVKGQTSDGPSSLYCVSQPPLIRGKERYGRHAVTTTVHVFHHAVMFIYECKLLFSALYIAVLLTKE